MQNRFMRYICLSVMALVVGCSNSASEDEKSGGSQGTPVAQKGKTSRPAKSGGAASSSPARDAKDWPQFRGPGGLAVSGETGLPTSFGDDENIVWKTELAGAGTSSPILIGDRIFLTCYSGFGVPGEGRGDMDDLKLYVCSLDRATGDLLWSKEIEPRLPESETIRDEHGYASSTPVADGERVYVFFGKTGVFAFDYDGEEIWRADVGSTIHGWGSAASPILFDNLVIVKASVESQSLVALDKASGEEKWRAGGINESWNTPLLAESTGGRKELIVPIMQKILAFDPSSGDQLWTCDTNIGWYMVPSAVAHEGIVYCMGGRDEGALAVELGGAGDVTGSHKRWTGSKGSNVTSYVYHDGHLYWVSEKIGAAYCAEAETGDIVYEERLPRSDLVYASPVLADGKIYYTSRSGQIFVVAAKPEFELLATNRLEERGRFDASPAVADGRLFIRSNKYLYCIDE
jgi:hypothetical protein